MLVRRNSFAQVSLLAFLGAMAIAHCSKPTSAPAMTGAAPKVDTSAVGGVNEHPTSVDFSPKHRLELRWLRDRPQKPPRSEHTFEVTLINGAHEPRWFILPRTFRNESPTVEDAASAPARRAGVFTVEVFELSRMPTVKLFSFLGTGGFQAIRVGARARVHLQELTIASWWSGRRQTVDVDLIVADDILLAGKSSRDWSGADVPSAPDAEVSLPSAEFYRALSSSKSMSPDASEVEVGFVGAARSRRTVSLR